MVGGDDRVEPVEVAGVNVGGNSRPTNRALSSSSGIRLIVESKRIRFISKIYTSNTSKMRLRGRYHVKYKYRKSVRNH